MVENYLMNNNINYDTYAKFPGLVGVGNNPLSYDFYISDFNLLIEVQGRQHKMPVEFFGGEKTFEIQKEHDKRKREYAESNGIELLEIWFNEFDNFKEENAKEYQRKYSRWEMLKEMSRKRRIYTKFNRFKSRVYET